MTDPGNPPDAVVGLSMIFSHGEYNTDFATDLTTRLIDHENSDQFIGWPALSGYTGLGFPSPTGPRTDPMAGIMDMLGNNADAAQRVFTTGETIDLVIGDGENPDQTVTVNANLDYLVNRDWSGIGGPNGSDEGVGLGNALEAATTEQRDPSDPASRTSAAIATDLFAIVGQTQETSQNMDEGLKGSVAIIMADYMPDIGRVAGFRPATGVHDAAPDGIYSGDYGGAFPPGMPPGAVLTRDQVQNIMFGLGMGDNADTNTATVLGGWAAADGMTANHLFSQLGTTDLNWSLYIQSSANLLSFMTESAVGSTHADLEAQAKQAKLINAAISAASSFPAFKAPVAVGQVGAFIWDQARSQSTAAAQAAVSRAMTDTSENTDEYINNLHNKATDAMVEAWVNAYINTGNVSPDDIAAGLAANGDGDRNNDILHIDLYRQYRVHPFGDDYTTWLAHSGIPEDVIRDKINTGLTWTR